MPLRANCEYALVGVVPRTKRAPPTGFVPFGEYTKVPYAFTTVPFIALAPFVAVITPFCEKTLPEAIFTAGPTDPALIMQLFSVTTPLELE